MIVLKALRNARSAISYVRNQDEKTNDVSLCDAFKNYAISSCDLLYEIVILAGDEIIVIEPQIFWIDHRYL